MALSVISSLNPLAVVAAGIGLAGVGLASCLSFRSHNGNNLTLLEEGRQGTSMIPTHNDDKGVVPARLTRLPYTPVRLSVNVNYTGPNSTNETYVILTVFDLTDGSSKEDGEPSESGDMNSKSDTDNSIRFPDWPVLEPDFSANREVLIAVAAIKRGTRGFRLKTPYPTF
ncbi:hypothetical protein TREMEDRAFT_61187 [Tremella mesenterica DSM 1558]|uniref:uncharacterized protein n=1 Tax=Tremella mesenterica (strain ATCC 24925 / CBS 8224 / DSM 1558 / NBRC 9311 / NRRL Y-6157 / RJB 2259-6 / UBC 559-6) TaxID=578456 RepID=UPI0003F49E2E|nr:uncharacterized protein TREMEDRAFT_61187 [Tremella mesenterica DSM 1558]EIW70680.1 hypothetical protein TREMEDRAFT_61187 [Tremella mesenterica DSM 1558]